MSSQKKIAKSCFSISFKKTRWLIVVQWGSEYRMFKIRKHFKSRPFISTIQNMDNLLGPDFEWQKHNGCITFQVWTIPQPWPFEIGCCVFQGWNWLKKSVSTSFRVRAATKSWSNYTTIRAGWTNEVEYESLLSSTKLLLKTQANRIWTE